MFVAVVITQNKYLALPTSPRVTIVHSCVYWPVDFFLKNNVMIPALLVISVFPALVI
jgi:hypothetical protein